MNVRIVGHLFAYFASSTIDITAMSVCWFRKDDDRTKKILMWSLNECADCPSHLRFYSCVYNLYCGDVNAKIPARSRRPRNVSIRMCSPDECADCRLHIGLQLILWRCRYANFTKITTNKPGVDLNVLRQWMCGLAVTFSVIFLSTIDIVTIPVSQLHEDRDE